MRPSHVGWVALCLSTPAWAVDARLTASTTIVPGVSTPAVTIRSDTGPIPIGSEADPTFRVGLGAEVSAAITAATRASAGWGLYRVQALCDVCRGGPPGWLGSELLGSTDLSLQVVHTAPVGRDARLRLAASAVLPASRASLSCDPLYAAPGAGATFELPVATSSVALGVSARRPIWRFDAAPVGRCAPRLRDGEVATLTGPVEATPWAGAWYGAPNPTLSGSAEVRWTDPHALLRPVPHLSTAVSAGLSFSRAAPSAATSVSTSSGTVEVPQGSNPVRTVVPWSLEAGWEFSTRWSAALSVANRVPTLLADPGGDLRALPATTAFALSVSAEL